VPLALEQFQRAVELDSHYALAWAGIADVFTVYGYYGIARPENARPRAIDAAERAIALDPNSAEAHTALACTLLLYRGDWRSAEREFLKALELNPHYIQGRCWYALIHLEFCCGRLEEGLAEARRALASDPLSSYALTILAVSLALNGRAEESIDTARRSIEADPDAYIAYWALGQACAWGGQAEEAVETHRKAAAMTRMVFSVSPVASALGRAGLTGEAAAVYHELATRSTTEYVAPAQLALAASAGGLRDEALSWAAKAWEIRDPFFYFARAHPDFEWLRGQPEFQAILSEMEAAEPTFD